MRLFSKKPERIAVTLHINARLQPMHREAMFEANLDNILRRQEIGCVTGGGTLQAENGEISSCDMEMLIQKNEIADFAEFLDGTDMLPKGSCLYFDGLELDIGTQEGLGLYLNGTDLPDEVYETNDVNELIEKLDEALADCGRRYSYWEGSSETALYYYGSSFAEMRERILPLIETEPLCGKCRVEQLA